MKNTIPFWSWFRDNNQKLLQLKTSSAPQQREVLYWLNKNLGYYCTELDCVIRFPNASNPIAELVITACGNPDYFLEVIDLVENAPYIPNWKITAFVKACQNRDQIFQGLDTPIIMRDISLKSSEIKFRPLYYDAISRKADIIIYIKNYTLYCNNKMLFRAVYYIMQNLFGEKSLYHNINFVQIAPLPENDNDLLHLYDFEGYLELLHQKYNCDGVCEGVYEEE